MALVTTIFNVIPDLPDMPTSIVDAGEWVTTEIESVISVIRMLLGSTLLDAVVVVIIAMFTFEKIYHTALWVLKKIPMINIK